MNDTLYFTGTVIKGADKARGMGFPTLNIKVDGDIRVLHGVYACQVKIENEWHPAALHYGKKSQFATLGKDHIYCEVHVFDFDEEIYGERVAVKVLKKIRNVREFKQVEDLKSQIMRDIASIKTYFKNSD